jgi:uncharacterized protein
MSLQQQLPDGTLRVRWVRVDAIGVEQQERRSSFLLGTGEIRDWSPRSHGEIDEAALDAALALQPELLLLGSGPRQRFLPPRLQALLLARGIGVECMDNGAAARTFNLLADEGRRVVAAFLIEAG